MADYKQFNNGGKKNITHTRILTRFAKNEEGKNAVFKVYISNNKVRFQVYTGLNDDRKDGKAVPLNLVFHDGQVPELLAALGEFDRLIETESGARKMAIGTKVKVGDKIIETARLIFGRNGDGVYFVMLSGGRHGKVAFPLKFDHNVVVYSADTGEPLTADQTSPLVARGFIQTIREFAISVLTQEYVEEDENKGKGNYNKGGNNSQQQSQQSSADSYDDDFSF